MKKLFLLLQISLMALYSCTPKNFEEPGIEDVESYDTEQGYNMSYDAVFEAAMSIMRRYPIVVSDKKSGQILTDWIKGKSVSLYSGYGENRIPYTIRFRFIVQVAPYQDRPNATKIIIKNEEQYLSDLITSGGDFSNSLYEWIDTPTTTYKEKSILNKIENEIVKLANKNN